MEVESILQKGAEEMGISLSKEQMEQFMEYLRLLQFWNQMMNLTSLRERGEMVTHHLLDSLSCYSLVKERCGMEEKRGKEGRGERREKRGKIFDAGTGAGFPSIPLLIVEKDLKMTLMDSSKKKCLFLRELRRRLALDFRVEWGRIEEFAHKRGERGTYSLVLTRALAPLTILLEMTIPLLVVRGSLIAFKAKEVHRELEEAEYAFTALKADLKEEREVVVPYLAKERTLLVIEKRGETEAHFPRRGAQIEKKPL